MYFICLQNEGLSYRFHGLRNSKQMNYLVQDKNS